MALLDARGLRKHRGGVQALDGVDLAVSSGEVLSVIGPNGAGKSTLVNVLTGQIAPDAGDIVFGERRVNGLPPHEISQLGMARVYQSPEIYPELTVAENAVLGALAARDGSFRANLFAPRRRQRDVVSAAHAAIDAVGLAGSANVEARELSRGDKRRAELAICLAARPRLLLLDEPTAGMSPTETRSTVDLLQSIAGDGLTMIVIEHDMDVVFALSHRIVVLQQGRVIACDTPEAIRGNAAVHDAYLGGAKR